MTATRAPAGTVPQRADAVELLGEMEHSGFVDPPCLVRRGDGQTIQLTELLYRVLESIDGERDLAGVADDLSERIGRDATAEDVSFLVEEKLRPLGLLKAPDGSEPEVQKSNPLLSLRFRVCLSKPSVTRRVTAPFALLFNPVVVVAVLVGFVAMVGWLFGVHGIAGSTRAILREPALLVLTFFLTMASAGWHEFGHAAGCRYGGATPGTMGAGIYLVWPAFYTDVTDSYRLDRRGRLRTDLGGLYFNCVFSLATFAAWAVSGWDFLLVLIPLQLLQMVHQLLPFVRLDGYHILADITGVPDLFARIKPTLVSAIPGRDADERVTALKPWVRRVVALWVVCVIPLLLFSLVMVVLSMPRMLATAWATLGLERKALGNSLGDGDWWGVAAGLLASAALILPLLSSLYILGRLVTRITQAAWGRASGPAGRGLVLAAAGGVAALAVFTWWPNGEYEPIRPDERGTIGDAVRAVREVPSGRPALTVERERALEQEAPGDEATTTTSSTAPSSTTTTVEGTSSSSTTSSSTSTSTSSSTSTTTTTASEETSP